jgi:hypothetical protein
LLECGYTDRKVHYTTGGGTSNYGGYDKTTGDPESGSGWKKEDGSNKNPKFKYYKVKPAITFEGTKTGVKLYVTETETGLATGWTPDLLGDPTIPDSLLDLFLDPTLTGATVMIPHSTYLPHGAAFATHHKDLPDSPASFTNEAVVIHNPREGEYCVTVWDKTGTGADFEILVSTEGGASIDLPASITGHLQPGESASNCGDATVSIVGGTMEIPVDSTERSTLYIAFAGVVMIAAVAIVIGVRYTRRRGMR